MPYNTAQDRQTVAKYLPSNTRHVVVAGKDVWIFKKNTQMGIVFEIGIFYDHDEGGYCAQLISPNLEETLGDQHTRHVYNDSVICLGTHTNRTCATLRECFSRCCVWAEGAGVMVASRQRGYGSEFPFSINNSPDERYR